MKNHIDFDSVDQGKNIPGHGGPSAAEDSAPRPRGAERALLAQLELSKRRELKTRKELERVRSDTARVKDTFDGFRDDVEKRSRIRREIHGAERDHLQRMVADLETRSLEVKAAFEHRQEEYSSLNSSLLLRIAELEAAEGKLEGDVMRLKNEVASYSRTMVKKEAYGRDKARRLDTALDVIAQERSKITNLQESSSMRIGRLITSSLKNPSAAFALIWRLPRMIYLETKKNIGETKK
ncbi:hypothetical protein [Pseudarthrobacter sp. PH31-O2]|uniref:hypothetical protein n=1 Tax=Pseudarthrobacter sp. PH31-O2 TaxID=3046206 RepID=UPI0024B8F4E1|nr:hypothetical protein [Pseudarthrobacter sp. PH31-O2]MDJ0351341.1 hypothetical protein [Pseudarthrobacter sp. PH31-O2]